jgi:recombination protein RecA
MSVKKVSLDSLRNKLNKQFGDVAKTGSDIPQNVEVICSTGSFGLDTVLSCYGIPKGRIIQLRGPESGGKTLLSLIMMAEVQKKGGNCAFLDLEGTYTQSWATKFGVNVDNLLYIKPKDGGETFDIILQLVESNIDFLVVDSIAVLTTTAEEEAESGQNMMSQIARLSSFNLKRVQSKLNQGSTTTCCFINQLRSNIGGYGNPETGTGGNAWKFYSSLILDVRRKEPIGDKENPVGFKTRIKALKSKVGKPFREVIVDLYIGPEKYGIDHDAEVFDIACQLGIIEKQSKDKENDCYVKDEKGSYYAYKTERFYGLPKMMKYIESNPAEMDIIKKEVERIMDEKFKPVEGSFKDKVNKMEEGDDYEEETEE